MNCSRSAASPRSRRQHVLRQHFIQGIVLRVLVFFRHGQLTTTILAALPILRQHHPTTERCIGATNPFQFRKGNEEGEIRP